MSEPLHFFARHGQTQANIQKIFRSRLDVPLDPKGEEEAHQAAEWLKERFPVDHIVTSPMQRAQATAAIYGQHLGIKPQVDGRLAPWDAGMLTGKERNAYTERVRDFYIQHPDRVIPGGESILQSEARMRDLLNVLPRVQGRVLLVTHGSGIKAADSVLSGKREPTGDSALVEPGGIVGIYQTGKGMALKPLFREADETARAAS